VLFAVEQDAHRGHLEAWRLPAFPPGHPERTPKVDRVRLAQIRHAEASVVARTRPEAKSESRTRLSDSSSGVSPTGRRWR